MPMDISYRDLYYDWMCRMVTKTEESTNYSCLLQHLSETPFVVSPKAPYDSNREEDGKNLRYIFADDIHLDYHYVEHVLTGEVSVFEVLLALAIRGEEIMRVWDLGDRTDLWFWTMIKNIGLIDFTDDNYFPSEIDNCLYRFMSRDYNPDGSNGGAFILENPPHDMQTTELWYQMCWYFNTIE